MIEVGLTGGIGAGKTTVAQIFSILGIAVYNSDTAAKRLMHEDQQLVQKITNLFGSEAYNNGRLNRKFLAGRIFSTPVLREKMNEIVHPAVGTDYLNWLETYKAETYVLKETAILFEVGIYKKMTLNISVSAPESLREERVMKRDGTSREQVKRRMTSQWRQEKKDSLSDYIIFNDSKASLIKQVLNCHQFILKRS